MSISRDSLPRPSLDDMLLGSFILPNSIILVKDLTRCKRSFTIFLIDQYAGDIGNINITGKYQNIFVSVTPILYWMSQFTQVAISTIPQFI